MTEQTSNNSPEKTTIMDAALTNSPPSERTKHHSDYNIQHTTTASNNSGTNDNNLRGSDWLMKK